MLSDPATWPTRTLQGVDFLSLLFDSRDWISNCNDGHLSHCLFALHLHRSLLTSFSSHSRRRCHSPVTSLFLGQTLFSAPISPLDLVSVFLVGCRRRLSLRSAPFHSISVGLLRFVFLVGLLRSAVGCFSTSCLFSVWNNPNPTQK